MPTIADVAWPRTTPRLTLRPARSDDLEVLWQIRRQEQVGRWMSDSATAWEPFLTKTREPEWLGQTLTVEQDGRVIGDLMLKVEDAWAQEEVKEQAVGVQAELG